MKKYLFINRFASIISMLCAVFLSQAGFSCAVGSGDSEGSASCSVDTAASPSNYVLSGQVSQTTSSFEVLLNPPVSASEAKALSAIPNGALIVTSADEIVQYTIEPAANVGFNADIVFVIDTTGSMAWAIDGVKNSILTFVDELETAGINPKLGGIEFGDDVRTSVDVGSVADFKTWVQTLSAEGGNDAPENPLDAMLSAYNSFHFRPDATRIFVVITDVGFHENCDGTEFATSSLASLTNTLRGKIFPSVVHLPLGSSVPGVHPRKIAEGLGGLYVKLGGEVLLSNLDLSADTKLATDFAKTQRISIPRDQIADPENPYLSLVLTLDGEPYQLDL